MRDLTLAFSQSSNKRKTYSVSTQTLNISMLVAFALLLLTYLFAVTSMGTKSYEIKKLELKLRALQEEQKQLQIESANLQSIDYIQGQVSHLNLVPTTDVTYIKDSDFALK